PSKRSKRSVSRGMPPRHGRAFNLQRMSAFDDIREIVPHQIWPGVVGRSVEGKEATFSALELDPNTVVPAHHHVNEQMGILLRGSLRFRIGDEAKDLRPGSMWVIPADVP